MKTIPVYQNENNELVVNARDLHFYLEVKSHFRDWIKYNIEFCELEDNIDYKLYQNEDLLLFFEGEAPINLNAEKKSIQNRL